MAARKRKQGGACNHKIPLLALRAAIDFPRFFVWHKTGSYKYSCSGNLSLIPTAE